MSIPTFYIHFQKKVNRRFFNDKPYVIHIPIAMYFQRSIVMKKNSKEWLEKETSLKTRAIEALIKSETLKQETYRYDQQIEQFMLKYPTSKVDKMNWLEKERIATEADLLFGKLRECEEKLHKLDEEYEVLRNEVNEFYGTEVMKKISLDLTQEEDDTSSADWWKK